MSSAPLLQPAQSTPAGSLDEGPLASVLGYQLAQASVAADQVFAARVEQTLQLRQVEYTLITLVAHNGGVTAAQLASALAVTPPNTAAWVERLMRRGLVEREQHARDRRALHIHATASGRELSARATQEIGEGETQALSRLSVAERLMLLELLHKAAGCRVAG